jgi:hypothetical protein
MTHKHRTAAAAAVAAGMLLACPARAFAHCDTLDGPVVTDARRALETADVSPALKWIERRRELEVREAFAQALAARAFPAARPLADRFFFETVVRLHREGEGAPYTGLKAAGAAVDPAIAAVDRSLADGDVAPLVRLVTAAAEKGLRERFSRAAGGKAQAGQSVEEGRAFVAAYVELVHYAERLHQAAAGPGHAAPATSPRTNPHHLPQ